MEYIYYIPKLRETDDKDYPQPLKNKLIEVLRYPHDIFSLLDLLIELVILLIIKSHSSRSDELPTSLNILIPVVLFSRNYICL